MNNITSFDPILVAVGIVLNDRQEVLVSLRPDNKLQGGLWEFPGGKIESGETSLQALKRELLEEVGLVVSEARLMFRHPYQYDSRSVLLDVFLVEHAEGVAYGREGQVIQWVTWDVLNALPMLSGNQAIVANLRQCLPKANNKSAQKQYPEPSAEDDRKYPTLKIE